MNKFYLVLLILFFSCNKKYSIEYFPDGNIHKKYVLKNGKKEGLQVEYFNKSGNIKNLTKYKKGNIIDTIKEFYDSDNFKIKSIKLNSGKFFQYYRNGKKFSDGQIENNQRIGEWSFFTIDGKLSEIRDYKIIDGKGYLNQNRYYDNNKYWIYHKNFNFNKYQENEYKQDTLLYNYTNYAEFDLGKDTIKIDEPWRAVCFYYTPIFKDKASKSIVILPKKNYSFNKDFSDIKSIPKDTFYSLSINTINKKYFPEDDIDNTIVFGRYFDSSGDKIISGYFSEYYIDSLGRYKEIRKFFNKKIFVKE